MQRSLELAGTPAVPEIRRTNLNILTSRNGSKALLSRLLNLSQSNIAHRLHGKKRLDDAESKRFTDVLGLPSGWLDTPREPADLPDAVNEILTPTSRRHGAAAPVDSIVERLSEGEPIESDDVRAELVAERADSLNGHEAFGLASTKSPDAGPAGLSAQANDAVPGLDVSKQSSNIPTSPAEDALPSTTMTDLDNLRGIAPIAEALLKTLAGKARTGRLNEAKALQLLQQVVLI